LKNKVGLVRANDFKIRELKRLIIIRERPPAQDPEK